eukprot:COSAG03_NODE_3499_length_1980_cov_0.933546_1_plen_218_part_10
MRPTHLLLFVQQLLLFTPPIAVQQTNNDRRAAHYIDGVFQYDALRTDDVVAVPGTVCNHEQWSEAECFTGASTLHPPVLLWGTCAEQRGRLRYDDYNNPYIDGGHCDYVCGYCASPCPTGSEVINLPEIAADRSVYAFVCGRCPLGRTDLDLDAFTPCAECQAGQYATVPNVCEDCAPGYIDHDAATLAYRSPCQPCLPGQKWRSKFICESCQAGTYA